MVKCMGSVMGMRLWFDTPRIDGEHVEGLKRGREWAHWRNEIQGRTEKAGMGEGEDLGGCKQSFEMIIISHPSHRLMDDN